MIKKLLFVCTGNTCRSPMAAALANLRLKELGREDAAALSAGLAAAQGEPASENAVLALREIGADLSRHRSRQITREDAEQADLIYALTPGHTRALAAAFPHLRMKLRTLGDIPDPFGGDLETYRRCRDKIEEAVAAAAHEWISS